jgi:hypothetical protein
VVPTAEREWQIRLRGTASPDGQISFASLGRLGDALQELSTRVGRWVVEQYGPGRSFGAVEASAELRLARLGAAPTTLVVRIGRSDVLPVDDGLEAEVERQLAAVVAGLATEEPPPEVPVGVRESALRVLDALGYAARYVEIERAGEPVVTLIPHDVDRAPWAAQAVIGTELVSVTGLLEAVDLANGRFRLRDHQGERVALHHVLDRDAAALLIGQQVVATGVARTEARGGPGIEQPTLTAATADAPASPTDGGRGSVVRLRLVDSHAAPLPS